MKKYLKAQVTEHAMRVRQWAEAADRRRQYPTGQTLAGWCAIASSKLWHSLHKDRIHSEIHMSVDDFCFGCHVFLMVDDHVVDITATQFTEFRNKKIVIIHHREAEQYVYYNSSETFESPEELRDNQIKTRWPRSQIAHLR